MSAVGTTKTRLVLVLLAALVLPVGRGRAEEEPGGAADPAGRIAALQERVMGLYRAGKAREAVALGRELLALCEREDGPNAPTTAAALSTLSAVASGAGMAKEARAWGERAVQLNEALYGPVHLETATALDNLGLALRDAGDLNAARPALERALEIREKILGPKHRLTALTLNNLGLVLKNLGEYEQARPLYERALAIREEVLGPTHLDTGQSLNNLAFLLHDLGELEAARPLGERALAIYEKELGPLHPLTAQALGNMGSLLRALGDLEGARPFFERALLIHEATLGPNHPTTSISLNNVGSVLESLGELEETIPYYERALAIRAATLGDGHPATAHARQNMGSLLWKLGRADRAKPLLESAYATLRDSLGPDHPRTTSALNSLALVLATLGELETARGHWQVALRGMEAVLGPDHLDTAMVRTNLADLDVRTGRHAQAREALLLSLASVERIVRRNVPGLDAPARLAFAAHLRWHLDRWALHSEHWPEESYEPVLRAKGFVARIERAERRVARRVPPALAHRFGRLQALDRKLAHLSNRIPFGRKDRERWQARYAAVATERETLDVLLSREVAAYREAHELLDLGPMEVQNALGEGEVLLDLLRTGYRNLEYVAWVVRPWGAPSRVFLGPAAPLDDAVTELLTALREGEEESAWKAPAATLASKFLEPLLAAAGEEAHTHTIYLCADAALCAVPLAVLPHEGGASVLDDFRVVSLPFATDLARPTSPTSRGEAALAIGGVDFAKARDPVETNAAQQAVALRSAPRGGTEFLSLPGSRAEVEALGARLGERGVVLLGAAATEAALRSRAPGRDLVHLATHGFFREDLAPMIRRRATEDWKPAARRQLRRWDPMLLAGLAMAGANGRKGGLDDDGILTAEEASWLDLEACDLVVLSACDTARGVARSGEGVLGLVKGFEMAGARHVVASLWPVDDEATQLLMGRFYDAYLHDADARSVSEALRGAALWLRDEAVDTKGRRFDHPRHWAAFVAFGR